MQGFVPIEDFEEIRIENAVLNKRLKHLLESEYIRSFDEWDQSKNDYKRDIKEADNIIPVEFVERYKKMWLSRAQNETRHLSERLSNGYMAQAAEIILEWSEMDRFITGWLEMKKNGGGKDAVS